MAERGGDPNPNRLMAHIVDHIDVYLLRHGFAFRENASWEAYITGMEALLYRYYEDETGGDDSYEPSDSTEGEGESENDSDEMSETLGESENDE